MKAIYKMDCDLRRLGSLRGVFIAENYMIEKLISEKITVCFGEVLGKHSDIRVQLDESDITMASDNPEHVTLIESLGLETGFNPLHYPASQDLTELLGLDDDITVDKVIEFLLKEEK
jgi:hypothetical protein